MPFVREGGRKGFRVIGFEGPYQFALKSNFSSFEVRRIGICYIVRDHFLTKDRCRHGPVKYVYCFHKTGIQKHLPSPFPAFTQPKLCL